MKLLILEFNEEKHTFMTSDAFRNLPIPIFEAESHSFTVRGVKAPSVTSIINEVLGVNPFWTREGRESGKATHKAIHYYAEGDLDFDTLAEETKPRLEAYIRFCDEMNWKPDLIEQPIAHPTLGYCGIPDQVQKNRCVVDFKNGLHLPQHRIQLSAYAHMLPNPLMYERWTVQLLDTGKYKLELYKKQESTSDFNVFCSMLNIYNWRKRWQWN
jgi:hypothetical protein